jgi:hypothetical protein
VWAGRVTINILPDDVLLLIFYNFYFDRWSSLDRLYRLYGVNRQPPTWRWDRLVHVCRRWRSLVFASPKFLDLKLDCGPWTRVELINIWPPLPIIIWNGSNPEPPDYNPGAAIVHPNRVCEIHLVDLKLSQLQRVASVMQEQFPALIHLKLSLSDSPDRSTPLPDGFLGGFAPRLQSLDLRSIRFPALSKLLLSATDLVSLTVWNIPDSVYFSPVVTVTCLAAMANLKYLIIGFNYEFNFPPFHPDRRPPPPTRTVLPALTHFEFRGVSEYSEDLMARIDAPLLAFLCIIFDQLIPEISQLAQFMRRTPRFQALNEAHVDFDCDGDVLVESLPPTRTFGEKSGLNILCELSGEVSSLGGVLTLLFPSIYMVEHLYIYAPRNMPSHWQDVENIEWLEIFHPFTAAKNLYIIKEFAERIAPALQELVGERYSSSSSSAGEGPMFLGA